MAKRQHKAKTKPKWAAGWAFLLSAFSFGLACIVAGVVVLLRGSGADIGESAILAQDVTTIGYWMIGMGVAAFALTALIWHWSS